MVIVFYSKRLFSDIEYFPVVFMGTKNYFKLLMKHETAPE